MPDELSHDNPPDPADPHIPETPHRPWWKQAISILLTVAVLIIVFGFVLPQLADYRTILDYIGTISIATWGALALVSLAFLIAYPIVLTQALRSLRLREAFVDHMAGTAITNSVPSGGAFALPVNYAMYMSWGFTPESISAAMLGAGVWDWLLRIALPVVAVLGIALIGEALGWMWIVSIGGIAAVTVMVVVLRLILGKQEGARRFARWTARWAERIFHLIKREAPDVERGVMQFRTDLHSIVDTRALQLTAASVLNHIAMAALFAVSVYAVGVTRAQIPIPWVVLAFALGRFLVMIPISPGGLGLVDLGWIGLLTLGWQTANPGVPVDTDLISAGVLLFRALSFLPPIPIGMATWLFWRANKSWRQEWQMALRGKAHSPAR
ncbi:MAG: YbhN family protein [Actinomycetota bacterium]